jgi:hypothetical protein
MNFKTKKKTDKTVSFASKRHKMRMVWKPFKTIAQKRKQMLPYKNDKKIACFIRYIHLAHHYIDLWIHKKGITYLDFDEDFQKLPWAIKDYVCNKYRHEKFNQPMLKESMDIYEAWRLVVLVKNTSVEADKARKEANRLAQHNKAVAALMRHKIRKCMAA